MLTEWTLDPLQLSPVVAAAVAYAMRARTLGRRGSPPPRWRVALFSTGIALLFLAYASPVAAIGEQELFSAHMLQHVVIGDLAPLCLLAGLTGPMLRPLLALRPVERLRVLANPAVALPMAHEGELGQELLERGLDPRTVRRAVRYGRAGEL